MEGGVKEYSISIHLRGDGVGDVLHWLGLQDWTQKGVDYISVSEVTEDE